MRVGEPTPPPTPTPTPEPTPTPTPTQSSTYTPSLYKNKSAAWITGAVGSSSLAELTDQFRGTTVDVKKLKGLSNQAKSYQKQIAKIGAGASTLANESRIKQLQDKLNNTREKIKSEIDGSKPNLKPITDVPSSSDNQAELEKNISEASLKQLDIDNKELRGAALRRNIGLALDLGLDILTVVTLLTPIPGDEAAAIAAQTAKAGAKTGVKTAAQRATVDSIEKTLTSSKTLNAARDAIRKGGRNAYIK